MSDDAVAKFVAECAQFKKYDLARSVEAGPTVWLLGAPTAAPDGMVGLATTPTQTVCFRREDILDAREAEGRFLINVATDTNLLVREEQVVRLNPNGCRCQEQTAATTAKADSGRRPNSGPIIIDCTPICSFETVCGPVRDPLTGAVIVVCWPQLVCRNPCEGGILV